MKVHAYFTEGAKQLKQWVLDNWPGVAHVVECNCRPIAGTSSTSIHGVGRALDIHFAEDMGEADNDLGDASLTTWSVMLSLWVFSALSGIRVFGQRAAGSRASTAVSVPIRITFICELSVPASNLETEFLGAGLPVPDRPACGEALPPAGATIDHNTDPCFQAFGKSQCGRKQRGNRRRSYLDERLRKTSGRQLEPVAVLLTTPGEYEVEVHTVQDYSKYDAVRYEVRARQLGRKR